MFNFLNNITINQYNTCSDFLYNVSLEKIKKENKKLKMNTLDYFIEMVEDKKEKDLYEFILDMDMRFFKIQIYNITSFFITCKYEKEDSIFIMCIPEEIYSNKKYMELFIKSYKNYCIETLNIKQITLEINNYYNTDLNVLKKYNFEPGLYALNKTNLSLHKNDINVKKIIFEKIDNKIKYLNGDEVNINELLKLWKSFILEEDGYDKTNIIDKTHTFKNAIEELKPLIKNDKNRIKNFYVYLNKNDKMCGFSCGVYQYNKDKTKSYYISFLFVVNEERGKGISTSLLEVHENFAKNNNFNEIDLSVLGNNLNAKNIYIKKHKYQIEKTLFVFNVYDKIL